MQSELNKLVSLGVVTVTAENLTPDTFGQCSLLVAFETKAGNLPSLEVAKIKSAHFSTTAILSSADTIIVNNDIQLGASSEING